MLKDLHSQQLLEDHQTATTQEQGLLPESPLGQRFLHYFHHGWGFIYDKSPQPGQRPQWKTETRYPLAPRNLWSQYQNPDELLGLRFGSTTNYFLHDIDANSIYHPANSLENFRTVTGVMEEIGLIRYVAVQSSPSGGLHVYYFFKEKLNSFYLAHAVLRALQQAGITVKAGQLELFPNPKPYNKHKPTNFNAHRLPLQEGSYILDDLFQPYSNDLEEFLNAADWSSDGQDYELLHQAIAGGACTPNAHAKSQSNKRYSKTRISNAAKLWQHNLEEIIEQGWTDFHQTNDMLKTIACYGIVFRSLKGKALVDYVVTTAKAAPGYSQFCRHTHEIRKRATQRAQNCEGYYTPYQSFPPRLVTYKEQLNSDSAANDVVRFSPNQQRHEQTYARVSTAVTTLKEQGAFPSTKSDRAKAIIAASKALYGVGVSQTTLHKSNYLSLWHPDHEQEHVNADEPIVLASEPSEKYPQLPDPWLEESTPELLAPQALESDNSTIYTLPSYMKVLCLPQAVDLPFVNHKLNLSPPSSGSASDDHHKSLSITYPPEDTVVVDDSRTMKKHPDSEIVVAVTNALLCLIPMSTPECLPDNDQVVDNVELQKYIYTTFVLPLMKSLSVGKPKNKNQFAKVFTGEQYHQAVSLRVEAIAKAKDQVKRYSVAHGIKFTLGQRQQVEQLGARIYMMQSGSPILWQESYDWFLAKVTESEALGIEPVGSIPIWQK